MFSIFKKRETIKKEEVDVKALTWQQRADIAVNEAFKKIIDQTRDEFDYIQLTKQPVNELHFRVDVTYTKQFNETDVDESLPRFIFEKVDVKSTVTLMRSNLFCVSVYGYIQCDDELQQTYCIEKLLQKIKSVDIEVQSSVNKHDKIPKVSVTYRNEILCRVSWGIPTK